jgi:tetratricopeptide (TPR) repeat protein
MAHIRKRVSPKMEDTVSNSPETVAAQNGAATDPAEAALYCTRCGTKNTIDANFCKRCGRKTEKPAHPPISDEDFALPELPEDKVSELLVLAFKQSESHDLEGAIKACGEALEIRPDSTSAHSLMGMLYEKKGERQKSIAEFEKVLDLNPGSIADREKLEQLRDSTTQITPRRITTSRRTPGPVLFEGQAGAAIVALAVFFLVVMIGAWAVWFRSQKPTTAAPLTDNRGNASGSGPLGALSQAAGQQQINPNYPQQGQQQIASSASGLGNQPYNQGGNRSVNNPAFDLPNNRRSRQNNDDGVNPASVDVPHPENLERFSRAGNGRTQEPAGTIHLPDSNQNTSDTNGASATSPAPANNTSPRAPGKIEITVSSAGSSGTGAARSAGGESSSSTMDSRARRAVALQAQLQSKYRQAVRDYLKSLDGAGDDAALIHQQIGVCFQRLDEKDSGITHYNDAIAEYKKLVAAGKNVESAQSGIRFCDAAIRNCQ